MQTSFFFLLAPFITNIVFTLTHRVSCGGGRALFIASLHVCVCVCACVHGCVFIWKWSPVFFLSRRTEACGVEAQSPRPHQEKSTGLTATSSPPPALPSLLPITLSTPPTSSSCSVVITEPSNGHIYNLWAGPILKRSTPERYKNRWEQFAVLNS